MFRNVLIVGMGYRIDILSMFDHFINSEPNALFFIEHKLSEQPKKFSNHGKETVWSSYSDAYSLIQKLNIHKVIFIQFGDFNDIALRTACMELNIPTYMASHGVLFPNNYNEKKKEEAFKNNTLKTKLKKNFIGRKLNFLKNSFYRKTIKKSSPNNRIFLKKYFSIRSRFPMLEAFEKINHQNLKLDVFICFNQNCIEWYKKKHQLNQKEIGLCKIIGIPYFDFLTENNLNNKVSKSNNIIFIDQHLYEADFLGWTKEYKIKFISDLQKSIPNINLIVKTHPLNNLTFWDNFKHIKLIKSNSEFIEALNNTDVILGFNSTLLIPMCALENKTVFTFEIHPLQKSSIFFSDFIVKNKVAEVVYKTSEIKYKLKDIQQIREQQNKNKQLFTEKWLYKFDGNSKRRLTQILTQG